MYANANANACSRYSSSFQVGVEVRQGSVLSPLLFILVLEALSCEFRNGLPWELLYADNLTIAADALNVCISKVCTCKDGMERKGLRFT